MKLTFAATMIRPRYFQDSIIVQMVSASAFTHSLGQMQSFGNALPKARFGMKSGSLRKADLPDW